MHRSSSGIVVLAALLGAVCPAAPLSALQDAKAVEHAADLRKRGAPTDEIVATLAKTYRLDAAGTAQVLGRVDVPAAEAAAALRTAGYAAAEAVPALLDAYRLKAAEAGIPLRDAGYAIDDVARGLRRVPGASASDVAASLSLADFDPGEVRRVVVNVLRIPAGEYAASMKESGADVLEVAEVLKEDYRLAAAPGGDVLHLEARYTGYETISAFRLVWQLDVHEAYQAMQDMTVNFSSPYGFLEGAGYEVPPPTIHRYRIADYRPDTAAR